MNSITQTANENCIGCVYFPPNLPPRAYPVEDYRMLQEKSCCFDYLPGDTGCSETRKSSCSLIDLQHLQHNIEKQEKTS